MIMKTKKVKLILSAAIVLLSAWAISSCSKKQDAAPVIVKTDLVAALTVANTLVGAAVEGTAAGQYTVGSKAAFQAAITAAQSVVSNTAATQSDVTNAIASLASATAAFNAAIIAEVDPANLIAYYKFDEGTGTSIADASGNTHVGTLTAGHPSLGGGIPTWSPDRKNGAAKALHFTKGGHIEVPTNAAFSPTEITVSMWVNLDSLNTSDCSAFGGRCANGVFKDNYMVSQNSYSGYKFQTQDDKYPFFTAKASAAPDVYIDRASTTNLTLKKWFQVAVTFKAGEMTFFINGVQINQKTDFTGGFITLTDRFDFVIGQELPNAKVDPNITWVLPHFEGFMDEVRIYKKVLTATQITTIYNQEK
jgi:hypothetical protein